MGGESARPMQPHLLLVLFATTSTVLIDRTSAICPARCKCHEDALQVSCAGASLEVVPIQLNPEVVQIDLSNNRITNMHFTLTFYNNLLSLNLSENRIEGLGALNFESQNKLERLDVSQNLIESLEKNCFKGLYGLKMLDLSVNKLEELFEYGFRDLHSLEVLRLTDNQIYFMEAGLFKPTKMLKDVYLQNNQLQELAPLSDAESVNKLVLSKNFISSIKEIETFPLTNLKTFILDNNLIKEIEPGAFSTLLSLNYLDLSDNNFTAVPTKPLEKLVNLTTLKFGGNFIETVPAVAFKGLFQLKVLHLNHLDFLTKIDSRAFVDNINLQELYFDKNIAIHSLPMRLFYGNPKINTISVKSMQLETVEVSHFPLDQLKILHLGGNPFECNCSLLWLWKLEQEQQSKNQTNTNDLNLDLKDIKCAGPKDLENLLLISASESQMSCSIRWIPALAILALLLLIATTSTLIVYYKRLSKHKKEKCAEPIPPHNYSTWDYGDDVYRHFGEEKMRSSRPHIVYV